MPNWIRFPLVAITGQVPRGDDRHRCLSGSRYLWPEHPDHQTQLPGQSAEDLLRVIPRAFRIAASGRPGPVLVDIPKDVQNQLVEVDEWPEPGVPTAFRRRPRTIERAAAMINAAARPILYLGGGVVHSGASGPAVALAEKAACRRS
jgi:acetolactate synthase-1/2/3 large subunit